MVVGEERADTADMMWNLEPRSEAGSGNWEQKGSDSLLQPPERTSSTNNLISDCWPLELQGDTCLSSLPPSLWSSRLPQEITTEAVLAFLEQARLIQCRFSQHQLFSSKQNRITACGYIFVCLLIKIYTSLKWKPYENGQCWVLITSEEKKKSQQ